MSKNTNTNSSGTLEQRCASALTDDTLTASQLAELVAETEKGIVDAETIAARMQEITLDPTRSADPAKAHEAALFASACEIASLVSS